MQDVTEKYYNDDELLEKTMRKYIKIYHNVEIKDFEKVDILKYITEKDKIHKVKVSLSRLIDENDKYIASEIKDYPTEISLDYDVKVYELVFMDYDKLDVSDVIEIINGFKKFLEDNRVGKNIREKSIKRQLDLLLLNENLPDELKLWIIMQ
jgi:hypothetical protein